MRIIHTDSLPEVDDITHPLWDSAESLTVTTYWSGESAPDGRHFEVRSLWSESALAVRFVANQTEPLVVSPEPQLSSKTIGLWDRDVCEIFLSPYSDHPGKYLEFEIAPTGEWLDLGIHQMPDGRETDWHFISGMKAHGAVEEGRVVMAAIIPWTGLGAVARAGTVWKGNLLRCVGAGVTRGYLAWKPTMTAEPNFHVPEMFGEFSFVG